MACTNFSSVTARYVAAARRGQPKVARFGSRWSAPWSIFLFALTSERRKSRPKQRRESKSQMMNTDWLRRRVRQATPMPRKSSLQRLGRSQHNPVRPTLWPQRPLRSAATPTPRTILRELGRHQTTPMPRTARSLARSQLRVLGELSMQYREGRQRTIRIL